ncbi:hypothetical protein H181DRAFT_03151 [Streptomyces sp. WMMB 714]|uniref:hypothetical protein n=1 Tax=Streptomyces sp. WMMB 714 TaxID=1286822 RepID=UPI0005F78D36|nr:hypothetical protein [Streptomyces sp. WMMB 714]SCK37259.1 hypothetical protein H181DRAFT_03151 [Streptomyces sp. WMMB 714]
MTSFIKDRDGRITAAPSGDDWRPTRVDLANAATEDALFSDRIGHDEAAGTGPEPGDRLLRSYQTLAGNYLGVYEMQTGEGTFLFCRGCRLREEHGYGWDERTYEAANEHAAQCRVLDRN